MLSCMAKVVLFKLPILRISAQQNALIAQGKNWKGNHCDLTLKMPAKMHLKMPSAQVICCICLQKLLTNVSVEATVWTKIIL